MQASLRICIQQALQPPIGLRDDLGANPAKLPAIEGKIKAARCGRGWGREQRAFSVI